MKGRAQMAARSLPRPRLPLLLAATLAAPLVGCAGMMAPSGPGPAGTNQGAALARAALADGAPAVAARASTEALARHPHDPALLLIRAQALAALGQPEAATAGFRAVLAQDPSSMAARRGLGRILLHSDPARAGAAFHAVLAAAPRDAAAWNDLGIARDLQGKHAAAQTAYRAALAAQPGMRAAQVNLALSLALGGNAAEGVRLLRPLAPPGAPERIRQDLAAAVAMDGDQPAATAILAGSLPADQAAEAVRAYAALAAPVSPAPPPAAESSASAH